MITDQGIAEKIVAVRKKFETIAAKAKDDLPWEQNPQRLGILRKRAEKVSDAIRFFDAVVENLPPCFELGVHTPLNILDTQQFRSRRRTFKEEAKAQFFKAVAGDPANFENLIAMGLEESHIRQMAETGAAPFVDAIRETIMNTTASHKERLEYGGNNRSSNLLMLPDPVALLRRDFVDIQTAFDDKVGFVVTIMPTAQDGKIPMVPLIPGGFAKLAVRNRGDEHKAPVNALFGVPVYQAA